MKSPAYDFWKMCFDIGAVPVETMKVAVIKERITPAEYKEITGADYSAP